MKLIRSKKSGQTIVELAMYMTWFIGFFVTMAYMFMVFDISQKQTMLVRNQAFIELGNFSAYSRSKHGKDDPKKEESQIRFSLGQSSGATQVNLDKIEAFKKAVGGELTLDISNSPSNEPFWDSFALPKQITKLVWLEGRTNAPLLEMSLHQNLSIAHNRSIDPNKSTNAFLAKGSTGLFSGSVHMQDFAKLANEGIGAHLGKGLQDNLDALRLASRQLVKNDPSLADSAAKLEKSLNAADGISSGAKAALISAAIAYAAQFVGEYIGGLAKGTGETAKTTASTSSTATKSAADTFVQSAMDLNKWAAGVGLSAPVALVTAPLMSVASGLSMLTSGVTSGALLGNTGLLGAKGALAGLSSIGQGVSMGMSYAGVSSQELNMATMAASIPGGLTGGLKKFDEVYNTNTSGTGDYIAAFSGVLNPVTSLVALIAPEVALPLSYVNQSLSMAASVSAGYDKLSNAKPGSISNMKVTEIVKNVGAFTMGVGTIYTGVAAMSGKDTTAGQYMIMAGGGLMLTGTLAEAAQKQWNKPKIINPITVVKDKIVENVKNAGTQIKDDIKTLKENKDVVANSMANIFKPEPKLTGDQAKKGNEFGSVVSDINKATQSRISNVLDPFDGKNMSKADILEAQERMGSVKEALKLNMQYHGADPEKLALVDEKFAAVDATTNNLREFKAGGALDEKQLNSGIAAAKELNLMIQDHMNQSVFLEGGEQGPRQVAEFSNKQIIAIRGGTNQKLLEYKAVANGQTFADQKNMEQELGNQSGLKGLWFNAKTVTGGQRTLGAYVNQEQRAQDLATLNNVVKKNNDYRTKMEVSVKATQIAEQISMYGPIVAKDSRAVKENARSLATMIGESRQTFQHIYSDEMKTRMEVQERKLSEIANGSREIMTPQQWMVDARAKVDELTRVEKSIQPKAIPYNFVGNFRPTKKVGS